ncbi:MAG: FAD-dependent monooxygenase [Gammaproteobacteria bacterium]
MHAPREFDVVVAGGGPIGLTLALALSRARLRCAVVEAQPPPADAPAAEDDKSLVLALSTVNALRALAVWPAVEADATPVCAIHVSDRGHFGALRLTADSLHVPALGYVVPARRLHLALARALGAQAPQACLAPARLRAMQVRADGVDAVVEFGGVERTIPAALVVGADGGASQVRAGAGIYVRERDFGQTAIVTTVTPELDHRGWAYERFTRTGPFALLPRPGGRCGLVWTVASDEAACILALDDAAFLEQAWRRSGGRLGRFLAAGPRRAHPLKAVYAERTVAERAVLVGNAAQVLHPNAAQGLNLGVRDVATLAERLAAAAAASADIGAREVLDGYAAARRPDTRRTLALSFSLASLFRIDSALAGCARGLALTALDLLPPAKALLARYGTGLGGRVPALARGVPP